MDYQTQNMDVLLADAQRLVDEFPDLYLLATQQARQLLARHGAGKVDPEKVWWHRFDNAVSDPASFTGWVHYGHPAQSLTLVELVLERFRATDQDNLDLLDQMGGLYIDGPEHGFYHGGNQVPVLARDLATDFWAVDFAGAYRQRLQSFWSRNGREHARLARVAFLASLGGALRSGQLSTEAGELARQGLMSAFDGTPDVARLARPSTPQAGISVRLLTVDGYVARDIVRVSNAQGRQVLYIPGDAQPLHGFDSPQSLYRWLADQAAQPHRRALLATHFSVFNAASDPALAPLRATLLRMADDRQGLLLGLIEQGGAAIDRDPFEYLSAQAKAQMIEQSSTLLVDNAQLRKQMWIGYLGAFISLGSAFAPLGWPVALTLVGASVTSMVLNIQQAVVARTAQERRQAILAAIGNGINAVFNLLFIALDAAPDPEEGAIAPTAPELAEDGIEVAPLQPTLPPRPQTTFNSLGLMERRNLPRVFKPQSFPRGSDPTRALKKGFAATRRFDQAQPMLDGPLLQTFATRLGALQYAKVAFDGPFVVYEIDAYGLAAVSLRENLAYNTAVVLEREGYPSDFVTQRLALGQALDDFANDGWAFDEVHLQLEGLHPSRIHLLPAAELEPQTQALTAWSQPGTDGGVLKGVRVRQPEGGQAVTQYSLSVAEVPQRVRYDPFRDCWRDDVGHAWRHDPALGGFAVVADPAAQPLLSASASAARLKELGIEVDVPFQLASPDMTGAQPIPRLIHSFWLGRHMPRGMIKRVLANAHEAAQGSTPFQTRLYLSIADADELKLTLERLGQQPTGLTVLSLEDSEFFQAFRQGRYYEHFLAASRGDGANLASAVDVLRYAVLDHSGGLYMDVDDAILATTARPFSSQPLQVKPGELLLNAPVRHRTLGMVVDFNNSNFGSLPNNPVLRHMSELSWQRFRASPELYRVRPYEYINTPRQMQAYAARISRTTGPGLFNEVIARELPAMRNFRNLNRLALGEVYLAKKVQDQLLQQLQRLFQQYCPLAGLIRIGATGSWMHTR